MDKETDGIYVHKIAIGDIFFRDGCIAHFEAGNSGFVPRFLPPRHVVADGKRFAIVRMIVGVNHRQYAQLGSEVIAVVINRHFPGFVQPVQHFAFIVRMAYQIGQELPLFVYQFILRIAGKDLLGSSEYHLQFHLGDTNRLHFIFSFIPHTRSVGHTDCFALFIMRLIFLARHVVVGVVVEGVGLVVAEARVVPDEVPVLVPVLGRPATCAEEQRVAIRSIVHASDFAADVFDRARNKDVVYLIAISKTLAPEAFDAVCQIDLL